MLSYLPLILLINVVLGATVPNEGYQFIKDMSRDSRIIGGQLADIKEVPWQVALLRESGGSYYLSCSGSLIGTYRILTAASCAIGTTPASWRVRLRSNNALSGGDVYPIAIINVHPSFGNSTNPFEFDLSVFRTSPDIGTTLARLPNQNETVPDGALATISGWGSTTNGGQPMNRFRKADTVIVSNEVCSYGYGNLITPTMICAGEIHTGGIDFCMGDTGGPLVVADKVVGVLSWGRDCGQAGYPGVSTRVASFISWINAN